MKLYFVRHGRTLGNSQGRYVGRTDEPLLKESMEELKKQRAPKVELVVASPMLRCVQTAECLYPGVEIRIAKGLEEMDFGDFEYKNYEELNGNPDYQAYIDSGGRKGFPGAESLSAFKTRCVRTYLETLNKAQARGISSIAYVVHGGTIMAVLEAWGEPALDYFDWQIKNGERLEGELHESGKIYIGTGSPGSVSYGRKL